MIVRPLSDALGIEISAIDLRKTVGKDDRERIRTLYDEAGLLVFRDQIMTKRDLVEVTAIFGEPEIHPVEGVRDDEVPEIITIATRGKRGDLTYTDGEEVIGWQCWHTDLGYTTTPCRGAVFYGHELPLEGGRTGFIDTAAAYKALSASLKERIENLHVIQSWRYVHTDPYLHNGPAFKTADGSRSPDYDKFPDVIYPLVTQHAVTGVKTLNCPPAYVSDIVEMVNEEGRQLLDELILHLTTGPFIYWHQYRPGDLLVWDNWRTCHAGEGSKAKYNRVMWRTTIKGNITVGRLSSTDDPVSLRTWQQVKHRNGNPIFGLERF